MLFTSALAAATSAFLLASTSNAAPLAERDTDNTFGLAITGGQFDPNYLQTYKLSYANSSAYLGQIKYQSYAEPLIVSGAGVDGAGNGLGFLSIHQAPTGFQEAYIVPHETQPIGFSTPHGGAPAGVRSTGFTFGPAGNLLNNGRKLFYACQNAEQAALNSYQIWWFGAGEPNGVSCKGPLNIQQTDGCSRS